MFYGVTPRMAAVYAGSMSEQRYPELIGLKLSADQAAALRRAAREDDRTVSGYLRRLIAAALRERQPKEHHDAATSR